MSLAAPKPWDHRIEPEFLGPLGDRPLAESAQQSRPDDLFPGVSAFLSARHQRRRRDQWRVAKPLAERLLKPDEHVLYVTHAMQIPPVFHSMALGAMALPYHQVLLVLTPSRVIEVLMGVRGKNAENRIRSFPWSSVRDLKLSLGKLTLVPAQGKKHAWKVPLRGDRKLLKLLLPRLKVFLLQEGGHAAQRLPLWHCPQCGAMVSANPSSCAACHTSFRSTRLAAMLSLAFPGAGLFYAGHPFLGALDFVGEVVLYGLFLLLLLEDGPRAAVVAAGIGSFLFFLTKLESIHLSHILTARSKPETQSRRAGYTRFAVAGGFASSLLIVGAFPLAGAARPVVDRDLDVTSEDHAWQGSRITSEWETFGDNTSARSQWHHSSGICVTLFAYPQGVLDEPGSFRTEFRNSLLQQDVNIVKDDEAIPPPLQGFRFVAIGKAENGASIEFVHYFVVDEPNRDLHHALAVVLEKDGEEAEELVGDLLSHTRWIAATPPRKQAP
ncbi:MAG TPA: hypothetical protein VGR38_02755 [Candidatus Polarisedimenticolia bacterium]|nr:hypothetical protein [Candidatus Polarisedimenticolia bacterium]